MSVGGKGKVGIYRVKGWEDGMVRGWEKERGRERDGFKKECDVPTSHKTILTVAVIGKTHSQTFSETDLFIGRG